MADALETGDAANIAKALGVVARAKGMSEISAQTGLSQEQLYRSFSEKGMCFSFAPCLLSLEWVGVTSGQSMPLSGILNK